MPLTPIEAMKRSPACQLSFKEKVQVNDAERMIDDFIVKNWEGAPAQVKTSQIPGRVAAVIVRDYEMAGWSVQPFAVDGAIGKAVDILGKGGSCEFIIQLTPRWSDFDKLPTDSVLVPLDTSDATDGSAA